ncbi:hypothetical protein JHD49_02820 [Sulfurimonas sp. SAG-AH-194-C21]|nr:hypothetical protein [Sulfurimonas sp. SAG-AH-194-C21]MDF1882867.1 hypothetical protein [Sulfurimonas sp. SAG-AH-194-C21]
MKKIFLYLFILVCTLEAEDNNAVPVHGFFDVGAGYAQEDGHVNFTKGALDFYYTKDISEKINVFIDLVVESDGSATVVDLERLYIKYDMHEYLQTTFGKFHTPYGYWNTAFHHGLQIQTSILRPKFLAFEDEGGVLASHSLGILASGSIEDFSYDMYITSGSRITQNGTSSINPNKDGSLTLNSGAEQDENKMYGANLAYYFNETKVGVHSFYQKVNIFGNRTSEVFTNGAYIAAELENLEFYSEVYVFYNKNGSGQYKDEYLDSEAYYAQLAYDFDGIKPYIRFEYTHYNEKDFYFSAQQATAGGSYDRQTLGINYSLNRDANIKLAVIRTNTHSVSDTVDVLAQFAVRF